MPQHPDLKPSDVLPHQGKMILLHEIVAYSDTTLHARFDLARTNPFKDESGRTPGFLGIELIVQAISALAGIDGASRGEQPKVGFVLGTRHCDVSTAWLPTTGTVDIKVEQHFMSGDVAVFDGQAKLDDAVLVSGQFKALQPKDVHEIMGHLQGS